jgi:dolichol-phosphate mannosyltransferase
MKPFIVMPTYNEKENLEKMIRALLDLDCGISILIVDDNSPDGTGEIADRLAAENENVYVRHRAGKQGLGTAYKFGFKEAIDLGATCVFEMDADFSHDPSYVPEFLKAIEEHDVIIGSRYVKGGGTKNWSKFRELISRGGGVYTRMFTGLKVKDPTAGFRCYRKEVLDSIDFDRIDASGYGFQVEMTYVCTGLGYDVYELPIVFCDRAEGTSKMSKSIVFEAMRIVTGFRRKYKDLKPLPKAEGRGARAGENLPD